jgi:hypothetical protein
LIGGLEPFYQPLKHFRIGEIGVIESWSIDQDVLSVSDSNPSWLVMVEVSGLILAGLAAYNDNFFLA